MKGKWNPKTKQYETRGIPQERIDEERRERKEGTHLERWSQELQVKGADLWRNILENNPLERVMNVKTYEQFKALKQTLVTHEPSIAQKWAKMITISIKGDY